MRKIAGHAAGCVMFGQSIGSEDVGKPRVVRRGVRIVRTLFSISGRIGLLLVERIFNQRFQWLVMRRKRAVFKTARHVQPAHTVRVQSKGLRSPECLDPMSLVESGRSLRRSLLV